MKRHSLFSNFYKTAFTSFFVSIFLTTLYAEKPALEQVLKEFDLYAEKAMHQVATPGMAIAIVKDKKVIFAKAYGVKKVHTNELVDLNTIFQIGSISKSFTSALVAKAVSDNKLKWDDKVINHWPEFRMYDPYVTQEFQMDDTLAQRSGLIAHAGDSQLMLDYPNEKMLLNLKYIPPITSFRSSFAYQNLFFNVAAKALEKVTKKSWHQDLKESILEPLHMSHTTSTYEAFLAETNVITPHEENSKGETYAITKKQLIAPLYTLAPAGGINSNCQDMIQWLLFQLNKGKVDNKQLISEKDMENMHTAHINGGKFNGADTYYCLGWVLSLFDPAPMIWHDGGTNGCSSMCALIPQENLGIIILTNKRGPELQHALALQFYDKYFGKETQDWNTKLLNEQIEHKKGKEETWQKKVNLNSLPLSYYVGEFDNPIYGKISVFEDNQKLKIQFKGSDLLLDLEPYNHDIFTYTSLYEEEKSPENLASFSFAPTGEVKHVNIEPFGLFE